MLKTYTIFGVIQRKWKWVYNIYDPQDREERDSDKKIQMYM